MEKRGWARTWKSRAERVGWGVGIDVADQGQGEQDQEKWSTEPGSVQAERRNQLSYLGLFGKNQPAHPRYQRSEVTLLQHRFLVLKLPGKSCMKVCFHRDPRFANL